MRAPQVIMIVMLSIGLGIDIVKHGESKTGKYNFVTTLIAQLLVVAILYWGGFWK